MLQLYVAFCPNVVSVVVTCPLAGSDSAPQSTTIERRDTSIIHLTVYTIQGLGPAVLCTLPKLPLVQELLHHKQQASCSYINNAGTWNALMHLGYHSTEGPT